MEDDLVVMRDSLLAVAVRVLMVQVVAEVEALLVISLVVAAVVDKVVVMFRTLPDVLVVLVVSLALVHQATDQMVRVAAAEWDIMVAAAVAAVTTMEVTKAVHSVVEEVEVPPMLVDCLDLHHTLLL